MSTKEGRESLSRYLTSLVQAYGRELAKSSQRIEIHRDADFPCPSLLHLHQEEKKAERENTRESSSTWPSPRWWCPVVRLEKATSKALEKVE